MISTAGKTSIKPGGRRLPCTRSILHHSWTLPAMTSVTFLGPCRGWITWGNCSHLVRPSLLLKSPQIDMGYGVSDDYGIHPLYGTMEMLIDSLGLAWPWYEICYGYYHQSHIEQGMSIHTTGDCSLGVEQMTKREAWMISKNHEHHSAAVTETITYGKRANTMPTAIEGHQITGRPLLEVHITDHLV